MKLRDIIELAVDNGDVKAAGRVADFLRDYGFNYNEILQFVQRTRPNITKAEWDGLLYESEEISG